MVNNSFYKNLESFKDFSSFSNREHYQRVPEDWSVFVADIEGSTKEIEKGNYRQVNTVGAAAITVCLRRLGARTSPMFLAATEPVLWRLRLCIRLSKRN